MNQMGKRSISKADCIDLFKKHHDEKM
jgi:molybdopterin/thiamine biosynthesis adenylyltransferase